MNSQYNVRLSSLFFLFVSLYIIVFGNLYVLQIRQSHFFSNLGKQQYHVTVTQTSPRAEILDRNNVPLAMNKDNMAAFITPHHLEQPEKLKQFLAAHFPQAAERLNKNKHSHFLFIKRRLTDKQLELINKNNLSDIKLLKEPNRYYPIESVGPIVGLTDIDNQGLLGIELLYNSQLAGKPFTHTLEKDARFKHFYFKRETKIEGTSGQPVTLTIDGTLQFLVYEELKDALRKYNSKEGAVLILDPTNGEILVMANYPDFDPNKAELLTNQALTKNKICTDAYELGSVIKIFLALAALESGVVKPDELIDCENSNEATLNGFKFTTYKANGLISFTDVMVHSNNIGVAKVAQRLGPILYEHYKRLKFGQKIGIFPGENKGFITHPDKWSKSSIIALSFGYEISATLMQLAQALGIIANNGYAVTPQLKKNYTSIRESTGPLYKPESIQTLKKILSETAKVKIPSCEIMGKTGTARLLTNGKYDPNRHIFTYAGIVQKNDYKRIIITFVKETTTRGLMASTTALPLFEQVAYKMLIHDKII
jgi:cell division protein FtsI (penicillin-binding protein 3)